MDTIFLTHDGLEKFRLELSRLVNEIRPAAAEELAAAREKGDLSENAEYNAAREHLATIDRKISDLHNNLTNVQIIDKDALTNNEVRIFSRVKLLNLKDNTELNYSLVDPVESDPSKRLISVKSPIAKGILGKQVGDEATITIPSGELVVRILSIDLNTEV